MPLLFSILEHYNLLSKQPNYTCGLFLYFWLDVYGRVLSESNHEHFQKALDFSREALLVYIIFSKINRQQLRQKEERDIPGLQDNLKGKSCLAVSSLVPWLCHRLGASRQLPTSSLHKTQVLLALILPPSSRALDTATKCKSPLPWCNRSETHTVIHTANVLM